MREETLLRAQRACVVVALAGSALAAWPSRTATYGLPKATLVVLAALAALLASAARAILRRRLEVPASSVLWAMALVIVAMTAAAVLSDSPMVSVMGTDRQTGLLSYAAYLVLAVTTYAAFRDGEFRPMVKAMAATAAVVAVYALLQAAGIDPLPFGILTVPVFSTLGNSNFLSGWMAVVSPLVLWLALAGPSNGIRRAAPALYGACLLVMVASRSFQGLPAALVGSAFVGGTWLAQDRRWARLVESVGGRLGRAAPRWLAPGAAAALIVLALAAGVRAAPLASAGLEPRLDYWAAAADVVRDHPVIGVGPDRFEQFYAEYYEPVSGFPYENTDNPHNVPLSMLVSGGFVLGACYVAFLLVTGWALVTGLRRTNGERRLLLAAVGGAWLAYQVQSLVSIDIPPLALVHWVMAAVIAVLAREPRFLIFGAPAAPPAPGRRGRRSAPVKGRPRAVLAVLAIAGLFVALQALRPMRAVAASERAEALIAAGDQTGAAAAAAKAVRLAPWQARNWFVRGGALERTGDLVEARRSARRAADLAPGNATYALIVAELAQRAQDHEEAKRWYLRAWRADPLNTVTAPDIARGLLQYGERKAAAEVLDVALERAPSGELWALKGRMHALDGRVDLAFAAYRRALQLDPAHKEAAAYLGNRS